MGDSTSTLIAVRSRRPRFQESPLTRRGPRLTVRDWSFMPGRCNRRRQRNLQRRILYSDEEEMDVAPEVKRKVTGFRRKARPVRSFKFVDDSLRMSLNRDEKNMAFLHLSLIHI